MSNKNYDIAVIGGGHNGLVCANYLARAGLSVAVFEGRDQVGGCCTTDEILPEYRNSTLAYSLNQFDKDVEQDLHLAHHGLKTLKRRTGAISLLPDGRYLSIGAAPQDNHAEIAKFSEKDADAHLAFRQELDECAYILRRYMQRRAPNFSGGMNEIWDFFKAGRRFRRLSVSRKEKLMNLMTMSLGDYLDLWFDHDAIKGFYSAFGLLGNYVHPYASGSAYSLLQNLGEIDGNARYVEGGMGALSSALVKSAESKGVEIFTGSSVQEVLTDTDQDRPVGHGIKLSDGRFIRAKRVVANCTPSVLYTQLLGEQNLPAGFLKRMRNYKYSSGTLKINVAMKDLPKFTALTSRGDQSVFLNRPINICPSLEYAERAFHDGRIRGFARRPVISMSIPTLSDPSLAPEGHHVASIMCQHYGFNLPDDLEWSNIVDEAVDDVFDLLESHAPGFRDLVVGHTAVTPREMEAKFGLTGGDIYHGAMQLNQMFAFRPAAQFADYRTPVENLYICGAGAHPGGGVTGLPGKLCAAEVLKDAA